MTDDQISDAPTHSLPSTSTMALSFAEVQRQLPEGVTLTTDDGMTALTVHIRGVAPGLGMTATSFILVGYAYLYDLISREMIVPTLVGCCVVSAYFLTGFLIGRRRVTVDGDVLRVRSVPLPLPGDGSVRLEHIDELQVVRVGKRSGSESWRIDAMHRGASRHVVHDLQTSEQALVLARYLAQEHRLPTPRVVETP